MECKKSQEFSQSYTFDEALSQTGYGRFHYKVATVCALCILCVGFQNGLTSYVFSAAQCELNIKSQELGLLNVAFMVGGTVSAFLWGMIADINGRKKVLIVTVLIDSAVTLACSFMQNFSGIMVCRFLNGFLIGCPGSISFTYLAEFHSPKLRAQSVCYSGIAFIAAWVLLPIMAFLILPLELDLKIFSVTYTPWRLFLLIITIPELIVGLCLITLPESPKFLHDKNDNEVALEILTNIYCQNMKKEKKEFSVKSLESNIIIQKDVTLLEHQNKATKMLRDLSIQLKKLFSAEIRSKTLLLCFIMFSNLFGYFGLGLWLPEFFIRFEEHYKLHPNESITLSELTFSDNLNSTVNCSSTFNINTFQTTLIVAGSALICNALAGWLAGKVSIKIMAIVTSALGGLSSLSIYWIRSSLGILIVSSIFQSAMATGNTVIGSIAVEQFPTSIGGMALSIILTAGRIGAITSNVVFSILLGKYTAVVIFIVSLVVLLGAALCLFIHSAKRSKQKDAFRKTSKVVIGISIISRSENGCS